ncbi:hypothetical protein ACYCFC_12295 [Stutzerimonas sp. NM35]
MRIDRDDIPNHIRTRKKAGPWRFVAILGIGSALSWTLAMMFGKPIIIDLEQIKRGIRFADQPVFHPNPQNTNAQTVTKPQALQELVREDRHQPQAQAQPIPRQTSFNDNNYQPREAVNTYTPPPAQRIAYEQPDRPAKRQTTHTNRVDSWTWENGHDKKRTGGPLRWTEVNGAIDWSTVCSDYRSGSFEYRDCRKGAKVAFKRICSRNRAACAAENNYMP